VPSFDRRQGAHEHRLGLGAVAAIDLEECEVGE